jgi:hypothetical protein
MTQAVSWSLAAWHVFLAKPQAAEKRRCLMPPRLITVGILAFWLAMTGLLLHREVVPMMLAEVSPTFQIDLTDEIGSPLVDWSMFSGGKRVGSATSKINALEERRYEFCSTFRFDNSKDFHGLKTIESTERVFEDGKLQALSMKVVLDLLVIEIDGEVSGQKIKPRILWNNFEYKGLVGEIDLQGQSNVVSSLKLISRLRGLHVGQTWTETPFDLSSGIENKLAVDLFKQFKAPSMIALVKADVLVWDRKEVVCHVIEYHDDANKDVLARVWARKKDGLVLQREVSVLGRELRLQRVAH